MISRKMILKICGGNFKNVSSNEKKWLQEGNLDTSPREIFHVYIIYVNISLNSFTLELIRTWEFFKKLKYHSPFKLIPNWSWNRMITCTNVYFECVFHYKSCQPIVDLRFISNVKFSLNLSSVWEHYLQNGRFLIASFLLKICGKRKKKWHTNRPASVSLWCAVTPQIIRTRG